VRFVVIAVFGHVARRCGRRVHHLGGGERYLTGSTRGDTPKLQRHTHNEITRRHTEKNHNQEIEGNENPKIRLFRQAAPKAQGRNGSTHETT